MTREELIAALACAEWPDGNLEIELARTQGDRVEIVDGTFRLWAPDTKRWRCRRKYMSDLGDALTLLPAGSGWQMGEDVGAYAQVRHRRGLGQPVAYQALAKMPLAALSIAALKAQGGGA